MILDTSALIVIERGLEKQALPRLPEEEIGLPSIVWAEALIGIRLAWAEVFSLPRKAFPSGLRFV